MYFHILGLLAKVPEVVMGGIYEVLPFPLFQLFV